MSQIGYGHGSEWMLQRFYANHGNFLENEIRKTTGLEGPYKHYDFAFDGNVDEDLTELDETKNGHTNRGILHEIADEQGWDYEELAKKYQTWWVDGGPIRFDGFLKIGDTYLPIEAKGHLSETEGGAYSPLRTLQNLKPENKGRIPSLERRIRAMNQELEAPMMARYGCPKDNAIYTTNDYYQLCNRLHFVLFLRSLGLKARMLYILFEGAWDHTYMRNYRLPYHSATKQDWTARVHQWKGDLGIRNEKAFDEDLIALSLPCDGKEATLIQ